MKSLLNCPCILLKISWDIYEGLFLSLLLFHWSACLALLSLLYYRDFCSYTQDLIMGRMTPPTLFFFVRIVLAILGPVLYYINFRIRLSQWYLIFLAGKPCLDFNNNCVKPIEQFWENLHLCCVECYCPWTQCFSLGI